MIESPCRCHATIAERLESVQVHLNHARLELLEHSPRVAYLRSAITTAEEKLERIIQDALAMDDCGGATSTIPAASRSPDHRN